jgi:hypothetical protein
MNVQHQNSNIILNSKQKKMISLTKLSHREKEREREREREERYLGTDFTMISGQPNSIMI